MLYNFIGSLGICHMFFFYQCIHVARFVGFIFYLKLARLSRAVGFVLLRMCILVCVLVGGSIDHSIILDVSIYCKCYDTCM